jgi:hypothetical protein
MPEVKASPATPDKSLSHSRYSLAFEILGLKIRVRRRIPSGPRSRPRELRRGLRLGVGWEKQIPRFARDDSFVVG